jgi:hypothetical protein
VEAKQGDIHTEYMQTIPLIPLCDASQVSFHFSRRQFSEGFVAIRYSDLNFIGFEVGGENLETHTQSKPEKKCERKR